jgi:hypothetical protein
MYYQIILKLTIIIIIVIVISIKIIYQKIIYSHTKNGLEILISTYCNVYKVKT